MKAIKRPHSGLNSNSSQENATIIEYLDKCISNGFLPSWKYEPFYIFKSNEINRITPSIDYQSEASGFACAVIGNEFIRIQTGNERVMWGKITKNEKLIDRYGKLKISANNVGSIGVTVVLGKSRSDVQRSFSIPAGSVGDFVMDISEFTIEQLNSYELFIYMPSGGYNVWGEVQITKIVFE